MEHVDFVKGSLRIVAGKSKAAKRVLEMTPTVKAILATRVAGRVQGFMFPGKKAGTHLTKLNNQHDAVLAKIGASFVLYEFRHTFATRFGEAVGDPIALAAILGHATLKVVLTYCHTQETHTKAAMQKYIAASAAVNEQVSSAGAVN